MGSKGGRVVGGEVDLGLVRGQGVRGSRGGRESRCEDLRVG